MGDLVAPPKKMVWGGERHGTDPLRQEKKLEKEERKREGLCRRRKRFHKKRENTEPQTVKWVVKYGATQGDG